MPYVGKCLCIGKVCELVLFLVHFMICGCIVLCVSVAVVLCVVLCVYTPVRCYTQDREGLRDNVVLLLVPIALDSPT